MLQISLVFLKTLWITNVFVSSEVKVPEQFHFASKFINSLIDFENQRDFSRKHDVALIRLEKKVKSFMFGDVIDKISRNDEKNAFYVHSLFKEVPPYKIHAFSFFVFFTDIEDRVRNFI